MPIDTSTRLDQVKSHLIQYIRTNMLAQGDQLPSEAEMAKKIGVSRNTIREAYISIEAEGIINRRHGMGTFVTRIPVVEESLSSGFISYPNGIKAAGYTPHFRTLSIEPAHAPQEAYEIFGVQDTHKLLCVERVILAEETPTIYIKDYFPPEITTSSHNWSKFNGSMIEFFTSILGADLGHMQVKYSAISIDTNIASHLQLPEGLPVISSQSIMYTFDNIPISYGFSYYNPNIFQLDVVRIIHAKRTPG
jgi:GntR family transcriptional regulator